MTITIQCLLKVLAQQPLWSGVYSHWQSEGLKEEKTLLGVVNVTKDVLKEIWYLTVSC